MKRRPWRTPACLRGCPARWVRHQGTSSTRRRRSWPCSRARRRRTRRPEGRFWSRRRSRAAAATARAEMMKVAAVGPSVAAAVAAAKLAGRVPARWPATHMRRQSQQQGVVGRCRWPAPRAGAGCGARGGCGQPRSRRVRACSARLLHHQHGDCGCCRLVTQPLAAASPPWCQVTVARERPVCVASATACCAQFGAWGKAGPIVPSAGPAGPATRWQAYVPCSQCHAPVGAGQV